MRRLFLPLLVMSLGLFAAGPAFATHFDSVEFTGDCNGWSADALIRLHVVVPSIDLEYHIAIVDGEGTVLLESSGVDTLVDEDHDHYVSWSKVQFWNDLTDEIIPLFGTFSVNANLALTPIVEGHVDQPPFEQSDAIECAVVPNEDVSWGTLKSAYR